ncbi:MAG TPA: MerR family transcriptional regulator [Acidimicrobiales bacterium]|nr:MerR family transcriptional regulator [Acidimicrobiales bacterium]
MELRVEQLSAQAGVSVDTIRYYQTKGLLDPPRREGRVAWYGPDHLARIARIRSLQDRGFTLATIIRFVNGDLDRDDEALVGTLTGAPSEEVATPAPPSELESDPPELFTLAELAEQTGVPLALLKAFEAEELLIPRRVGSVERYTRQDVESAQAGLLLLEWGLPLSELLELSRRHHAATVEVARTAVEMFSTHVRGKLRAAEPAEEGPADDGTSRLVEAFMDLLPAVTTLVEHHFTRTLLKAAFDHIEQVGSDRERQAVWEQVNQTLPLPDTAARAGTELSR